MEQKGFVMPSAIIAALVIGVVVVLGLYVVIPRATGGSGPAIPGLTEEVVQVDFDVNVTTPGFDSAEMSLGIDHESISTHSVNQFKMLGPLWLEDVYKRELVAKIIKDGHVTERSTRNVKITEASWELHKTKKISFSNMELGHPGSGQYIIRVELYNNNGDLTNRKEASVTI